MTPYYEDDAVTIYHGDAREAMPVAGDVLLTDPPYGTGYYAADTDVSDVLAHWVTQYRTAAVFGFPEPLVGWCVAHGLRPDEWVTWWPTNKVSAHRGRGLARECEHVAIFGEAPGASTLMRPRKWQSANDAAAGWVQSHGLDPDEARAGDVWRDPAPGMGFNSHQRLHPNQKPLALMQKLVQVCSGPGALIVEPFMGSGTTVRAARDLGRRVVAFEIDEAHCETAVRRLGQSVMDFGEAA